MVDDALIEAIAATESRNDPAAVGDNGKAFGVLQIRAKVVKDVNKLYGTKFNHRDAFSPGKAKRICRLYLTHYGKRYERLTGQPATYIVLAAIWNGGPNGWRKLNGGMVASYCGKVVLAMEAQVQAGII